MDEHLNGCSESIVCNSFRGGWDFGTWLVQCYVNNELHISACSRFFQDHNSMKYQAPAVVLWVCTTNSNEQVYY